MASGIFREIMRRVHAQHLDAATVSKEAGLSASYLRDLGRKGTKEPRPSALDAIAKRLGCSADDLKNERPSLFAAIAKSNDTVSIDELDVHATEGVSSFRNAGQIMASHEAGAVVGTHIYPANSFREAYGIQPKRIRIIPVRGTSMEPELWSGQRVMVDVQDKIPSPPGIFVLWDGLGLVLKYVEVIAGTEPLQVRISSAHPAFKPYDRMVDEARINGRVVGVWKRL
jgi:phage repressor protein C with HTH and peptisase S24 domain